MRHCLIVVLFSLLSAFLSAHSPCEAAILYVPKVYETIQSAIDDGNPGDTVLVAPGRYPYINFNGFAGTVASYYLTTGDESYIDSTFIDANDHRVSAVRFNSRETPESRLTGFTITGGNGSMDLAGTTCGGGIHCLRAEPRLDHLKVSGNRAVCGGGIFLQDCDPVLSHIVIDGNDATRSGGGIYFSRYANPELYNCLIINNRAATNGSGVSCYYGTSPTLTNVTICNNITISDGTPAAVVTYQGNRLTLNNCIIFSNSPRSIDLGTPPGDTVIVNYSMIEGDRVRVHIGDDDSLVWGNGNLATDPLFRDVEAGDYRLSADSPCIDAGDPDSPEDPDGTRADMGAYAYHQQDIEVYPPELFFWALPFGEVDSQLVLVVNIGDSPLTFQVEQSLENSSVTMREADGRQIVVQAGTGHALYAFHHSIDGAEMEQTFTIRSDDPDEAEIRVTARVVLEVSEAELQPQDHSLLSANPNPFNSSTTIRYFQSPHAIAGGVGGVSLRIYDLSGRLVADLLPGRGGSRTAPTKSVEHSVVWNADGLPGGIYLIRLEAGSHVETLKIQLIK